MSEPLRTASTAGGEKRRARVLLAIVLGALLLASLLAPPDEQAGTPLLIAAAALLPVVAFAGLTLLLDRHGSAPRMSLLTSMLWAGTVGALGAQGLNDFALEKLPRPLVWGLVGPFVEEVAKGSALVVVMLVWRDALRGIRAGVVGGALAGLGFAATENLGYYTIAAVQGGSEGLARALYLRGVLQGLNHAAFSAMLGAAVGWAHGRDLSRAARVAAVGGGLLAAVGVHAIWNWFASPLITAILCNAPSEGAACAATPDAADLFLRVPALVAAVVGPVAVVLVVLMRREEPQIAQMDADRSRR